MYNNFPIEDTVREIDIDGRLRVAQSNISKEAVNPYYGREVPNYLNLGLDPEKVYMLYRPGEELAKAADSFNGVQIVDEHIPMFADNPNKDYVIGATGTDAVFESPYLKNSLIFWDSEAIGSIEAADKKIGGAKELSCGYSYTAVMKPGQFDGQNYDGYMTDIIGNHLALVGTGRAGHDVKVADNDPFKKERYMRKQKMKPRVMEKIKAMDMEIDPQYVDSIIDAVLGVEQEAQISPDPLTMPPEMEDPQSIARQLLSDRGLSADDIDSVLKLLTPDCGMDEKDDDKDEKDNDKDDKKDTKASDEKDDDKDDDKDDKKAEDEKEDMKEEVKKAMDEFETKLRKEFSDLENAKNDVREIVGDVMNINKAEEVYRFALDQLSIEHTDIKELSALKALCKVGQNRQIKTSASHAGMAQDSQNFASRYPLTSRIRCL